MSDENSVDLDVELIKETDGAILITDGFFEVWILKSQIVWDEYAQEGDTIEINIPEWLAEQKGLI